LTNKIFEVLETVATDWVLLACKFLESYTVSENHSKLIEATNIGNMHFLAGRVQDQYINSSQSETSWRICGSQGNGNDKFFFQFALVFFNIMNKQQKHAT